jgi:hypothetical protein
VNEGAVTLVGTGSEVSFHASHTTTPMRSSKLEPVSSSMLEHFFLW